MPTEQRDWYDTPHYYDIVFDEGTQREADFLEGATAQYGTTGGQRLLEPACGSGRLALEMARRGWAVCGFDGNAHMIDYARKRLQRCGGLKATLWEDQMQDFTLPRGLRGGFDMAHCLVSTFKYLLTERDAVACLRGVATALRPGGIFLLGLHLTDYARCGFEHERWVAQRGKTEVVCNTRTWPADSRARLEKLRTRLRITSAGRTHMQETRWHFRTYDAAQLRALLRKVPELALIACHDFTYDLAAPRVFDDSYADVLLVLRRRA